MNLILDRQDIKHIQKTTDWLKLEANTLESACDEENPNETSQMLVAIVKKQELLFSSVQKIITNTLKKNVLGSIKNTGTDIETIGREYLETNKISRPVQIRNTIKSLKLTDFVGIQRYVKNSNLFGKIRKKIAKHLKEVEETKVINDVSEDESRRIEKAKERRKQLLAKKNSPSTPVKKEKSGDIDAEYYYKRRNVKNVRTNRRNVQKRKASKKSLLKRGK